MTQPSTPQNLLQQGKAVSSEADDVFKTPIRVVAAACYGAQRIFQVGRENGEQSREPESLMSKSGW